MLGIPVKLLFAVTALLGIAGGVGYLIINRGPATPELDPVPHHVYSQVADRIIEQAALPERLESVLLPPVPGDSGRLLLRVRDRLEARGLPVVLHEGWEPSQDRSLPEIIEESVRRFLGEEEDSQDTGELPKERILLGMKIRSQRDDDEAYELDTEWSTQRIESGRKLIPLGSGSAKASVEKSWFSLEYAQLAILSSSGSTRTTIWLVILLGFPFLMLGSIRKSLLKESNAANAWLLVRIALPALVASWVLTGFGFGWVGSCLAWLGTAVAVTYSFLFCSTVEAYR